ncbi:hypothetical protein RRG08_009107 [Elysia crispata]|uniref:Uncharacterized protein n=1 Tax=Elysia crispata TaxID=231223 RepID=A0AAE1DQ15_9GAST|nr:hypothetical protein RRG08_009107 [Elysia crispata]
MGSIVIRVAMCIELARRDINESADHPVYCVLTTVLYIQILLVNLQATMDDLAIAGWHLMLGKTDLQDLKIETSCQAKA